MLRKATFEVLVHAEHHFFKFRVPMTPVCDLGENHRIDNFRERRLKIGADVVHDAGALFGVDAERSEGVELNCFLPLRQSAEEVFDPIIINDEERRRGFKVEIDTDAPFSDIRTGEDDSLLRGEGRPAGKGIKLHNHRSYTFSMRSCGATASTFS
ncbi:hypothetical protein BTN45_05870 [Rhizobium sp. ZX09]|nr:hypothetical protein BTN45_05870 [Rhizobium sp. ZX09]